MLQQIFYCCSDSVGLQIVDVAQSLKDIKFH